MTNPGSPSKTGRAFLFHHFAPDRQRNIIVDFEYGIYDCSSEKMVYGAYVPLQTARKKVTSRNLPTWNSHSYYFGVQFPNREAHLINQLGIWSFSSFVLLIVIVFFAYSLFVILKQKRLSSSGEAWMSLSPNFANT